MDPQGRGRHLPGGGEGGTPSAAMGSGRVAGVVVAPFPRQSTVVLPQGQPGGHGPPPKWEGWGGGGGEGGGGGGRGGEKEEGRERDEGREEGGMRGV